MGSSPSTCSPHGIEWQENIKYYQYGPIQPDRQQLMTQIRKGKITQIRLYKVALSNLMWFADGVLFHAFVTFRTVDSSGVWWWSLEKNQASLVLQRSNVESDVRDMLNGRKRRSFVNPKILHDILNRDTKFMFLHSYIIITNQLGVGYKFAEKNCKGFAKKVFDFVAKPISWDYDPENDVKMVTSLMIFLSIPVVALLTRKLRS